MALPSHEVRRINDAQRKSRFSVFVVEAETQRQACYRLRYNVFAGELGAQVRGAAPGMDKDRFDEHCQHLAVYDNQNNKIIATTRLLNNAGRAVTGMFYSETEFDLGNILNPDCRFIEVGRTCIHPDYRRGAALPMLWQGIARLVVEEDIDYLIGCASIPLSVGPKYLASLMTHLRNNHYAPESLRVQPRVPLRLDNNGQLPDDVIVPTLLKAYLRQGAIICGEPYWDAAFGVADVFVLLECERISNRYLRHFINRV